MSLARPIATLLGCLLMASGPAQAQNTADEAGQQPPPVSTRFKCQDGGELSARFAVSEAKLVAIVESGDATHALPVQPWTGGPAVLKWSDGQHTLTWSPGVQIMWMDGGAHRVCGRGEHKH